MRYLDITDQIFGRWKVLKHDDERTLETKRTYWICECQCPKKTIRSVKYETLKNGKSRSCGCLAREKYNQNNAQKVQGKKFNHLTLIEPTDQRTSNGKILWKCQCDCEKKTIIYKNQNAVTSGAIKSCGCVKISKGEEKILNLLTEANIPFIHQKSFDTCRFEDTQALAKFDFYVDNKYIIEYDGEQHYIYKEHAGWNDKAHYDKVVIRDNFKNNWCKQNNIPIIRIPYTHLKSITLEDLQLETSKFLL